MRIVTRTGVQEIDETQVPQSERSLAGMHWNAIGRYLSTGQTDDYVRPDGHTVRGLDYFDGLDVGGWELETRYDEIDDMEMVGELDQDIYEV